MHLGPAPSTSKPFCQATADRPHIIVTPTTMALCHKCRSVPIRSILKLSHSDRSVYDEFQWYHLPRDEPCIPWHDSLSELRNGVSKCAFCDVVYSHLIGSYHYQKNHDNCDGRLWLTARVGTNILSVYLGDVKPEWSLSGNLSFHATPGRIVCSVASFR
jgi:hypothetical protein